MIDLRFKDRVDRAMLPTGRVLNRIGLTANRLTLLGVLGPIVGAWQVYHGHLLVAAVIATVGCLFDLLDGAAAKAAGGGTRRGAYLDSVVDRVSEGIVYFGIISYSLRFRSERVAYLAFFAFVAAFVTSYTRAKADAIGVDGKAGIFERAERLVTIGLAAVIPGAWVPGLWVLAVGSGSTALFRMAVVWGRISRMEGLESAIKSRAGPAV